MMMQLGGGGNNSLEQDGTTKRDVEVSEAYSRRHSILSDVASRLDDIRNEDAAHSNSVTLDDHEYFSGHGKLGCMIEQQPLGQGADDRYLNKFPDEIQQHIDQVNPEFVKYGLFPEIDRAWVAVERVLYLWKYDEQNIQVFDVYNGSTSIITSVCLSTPKKDVFLTTDYDSVNYILVVASSDDLYILGVQHDASAGRGGTIHLIPTEFIAPTDDVKILKMAGSRWGKVYMIGDDSLLYELSYDYSSEKLFGMMSSGPKCMKVTKSSLSWKLVKLLPSLFRSWIGKGDSLIDIKVDNARHILYCVSSNGFIYIYGLEDAHAGAIDDSKSFCNPDSIQNMVYQHIHRNQAPPNDLQTLRIKDCFVIPAMESKNYCLVVVLSDGKRVYLNTNVDTKSLDIVRIIDLPAISDINSYCNFSQLDRNDSSYTQLKTPPANNAEGLRIDKTYYSKGIFVLGANIPVDNGNKNVLIVVYESQEKLKQYNVGSAEMVVLFDDVKNDFDFDPNEFVTDIAEQVTYYTADHVTASLMTTYCLKRPCFPVEFLTRDSFRIVPVQGECDSTSCLSPNLPCTALPRQCRSPSWGLNLKNNPANKNFNNGWDDCTLPACSENFLQHIPIDKDLTRKLVVITDKGVRVLNKLRPADIFMRNVFDRLDTNKLLDFMQHFGKLHEKNPGYNTSMVASSSGGGGAGRDEDKEFERENLRQCLTTILGCMCGLPFEAGQMNNMLVAVNQRLQKTILDELHKLKKASNKTDPEKKEIIKLLNKGSREDKRTINTTQQVTNQVFNIVIDSWYLLISRILKPIFQSWVFKITKDDIGGVFGACCTIDIVEKTLPYLRQAKEQFVAYYGEGVRKPVENIRANLPYSSDEYERNLYLFMDYNVQYLELIRALKGVFSPNSPFVHIISDLKSIHANSLNTNVTSDNVDIFKELQQIEERSFTANIIYSELYYVIRKFVRDLLQHLAEDGKSTRLVTEAASLSNHLLRFCPYFFSEADKLLFDARLYCRHSRLDNDTLFRSPPQFTVDEAMRLWRNAIIEIDSRDTSSNFVMVSTPTLSLNFGQAGSLFPIPVKDYLEHVFKTIGKVVSRRPGVTPIRVRMVDLVYEFYKKKENSKSVSGFIISMIKDMLKRNKKGEFFMSDTNIDDEFADVGKAFLMKFKDEADVILDFLNMICQLSSAKTEADPSYHSGNDLIINLMKKLATGTAEEELKDKIIKFLEKKVSQSSLADSTYSIQKEDLLTLRRCYSDPSINPNNTRYDKASNLMYKYGIMRTADIPIDDRVEFLDFAQKDASEFEKTARNRGSINFSRERNDLAYAKIQKDAWDWLNHEDFEGRGGEVDEQIKKFRDDVLWIDQGENSLANLIYSAGKKLFNRWELLLRLEVLKPPHHLCHYTIENTWRLILFQETLRDFEKERQQARQQVDLAACGMRVGLNPRTLMLLNGGSNFSNMQELNSVVQHVDDTDQNSGKYKPYLCYEYHRIYNPDKNNLLVCKIQEKMEQLVKHDKVRASLPSVRRKLMNWVIEIFSKENPSENVAWCQLAFEKMQLFPDFLTNKEHGIYMTKEEFYTELASIPQPYPSVNFGVVCVFFQKHSLDRFDYRHRHVQTTWEAIKSQPSFPQVYRRAADPKSPTKDYSVLRLMVDDLK